MNPFLYDVQRVLRNTGVILIMVGTTLLSLAGLTIFIALGHPNGAFQATGDGKVVVLIMGLIFAFFVPILGIQTGYSTYARDRATGILESVLVRPVSRGRIILSRFLAVGVASTIGIGSALGLLDLLSMGETGYWLPAPPVAGLFVSLVVEAVAFAGILFLIAHLLKAPGAIFGISVVIFVVIDVVWFFLLVFVGILLGGLGTEAGLRHMIALEFLDPSGFPFLTLAYVQGGLFDFFPIPPGALPWWALVLAGLGWALGPFLLAFYRSKTHD